MWAGRILVPGNSFVQCGFVVPGCLGSGVYSRVLGKRVEVEPSFFFLQDELSLSLFPFINYFG